jgi:TATA-box binding protein (TBP) (component of TFIID and TFIIIB)
MDEFEEPILDIDIATEVVNDYPKKEDMKVATRTLICKIGTYIDIKKVIENIKLETGKIEEIKFGNKKDLSQKKIVSEKKKAPRKNKKTKKTFYNQVTLIVKPFPERPKGVNMKVSENGSLQLTGPKTIEEGHLTIRKMLEYLYEYDNTVFYKKIKDIKDDVTECSEGTEGTKDTVITDDNSLEKERVVFFSRDELDKIQILSTKVELIIVSFQLPFLIHLNKLNSILKEKYNLLSIFGTSSYPGVNTKFTYNLDCKETEHIKKKKRYLCNCRDMSIFTFRTGKVIITGFEKIEKIEPIFEKYVGIIRSEEANIKIDSSSKIDTDNKSKTNKLIQVNGKVFEIVEDFNI